MQRNRRAGQKTQIQHWWLGKKGVYPCSTGVKKKNKKKRRKRRKKKVVQCCHINRSRGLCLWREWAGES